MVETNFAEFFLINNPERAFGMLLPLICEEAMEHGLVKFKRPVLSVYKKNNMTGENQGNPIDPQQYLEAGSYNMVLIEEDPQVLSIILSDQKLTINSNETSKNLLAQLQVEKQAQQIQILRYIQAEKKLKQKLFNVKEEFDEDSNDL